MLSNIEEISVKYLPNIIDYSHPKIWYREYGIDEGLVHYHSFKTIREFYAYNLEWYSYRQDYQHISRAIKISEIYFNHFISINRDTDEVNNCTFLCKKFINNGNETDNEMYGDWLKDCRSISDMNKYMKLAEDYVVNDIIT